MTPIKSSASNLLYYMKKFTILVNDEDYKRLPSEIRFTSDIIIQLTKDFIIIHKNRDGMCGTCGYGSNLAQFITDDNVYNILKHFIEMHYKLKNEKR